MPGMRDFVKETFQFRSVVVKTTAYTVLATDEKIQFNPTSTAVLTLPAINSFQGTTFAKKAYLIANGGTADATITPVVDTVTNVLNTINGGKTTYTLKPNESIIIEAQNAATDWSVVSPYPKPALNRVPWVVTKQTNGTTAVHIFDSNGAPADLQITEVFANALDTIASTITLTGGASTICAIAKGTTLSAIVPATTLSNVSVAAGSTLSMVGDGTGDARVTIIGTIQQYV